MAKRVALPDGSIGEFPDGMTDSQIEAVLARQFGPNESAAETQRLAAHPAPPPRNTSKLTDVLLGVGDVVRGTGNTLNRVVRGVSGSYLGAPEQTVREGKQVGDYVGEIGTDIALGAAPVARLARTLQALKAGRVVAPVLANAGYAAATTDQDRLQAGAFGGGGAALGAAANRVVSGLVRPSDAALQLLHRGVDLTPGQAGKGVMGAVARGSENIAEGIPGVGRWVSKAREGGVSGWNQDLLERVNTAKYPVGRNEAAGLAGVETGRDGIKAVQRAFGDAYKGVLPAGTPIRFDDAAETSLSQFADATNAKLPPSARAKFTELSEWLNSQLKTGITADQWKEVVELEIAAARRVAKRDGQHSLMVALDRLGKRTEGILAASAGAENVARLNNLDRGYRQFSVLKKAMEKAGPVKRDGVLYPADVATTAAKSGVTELQDEAVRAQAVFGSAPESAGQLTNALKTLGAGAAGVFVSPHLTIPPAVMALLSTHPVGRKVLLGQYPLQRFLLENPEIAQQIGRAVATSGAQE